MKPRFEPLEILDWYDGVVVGVVRIGDGGSLFLAALLCWAQVRRLRVYALLDIERADVDRLRAPDLHWPRMRAEVERSFAEANREIAIVCVDEATDTVVAEKRLPSADVVGDVVSDIEQAMGADRTRWLDTLVPKQGFDMRKVIQ